MNKIYSNTIPKNADYTSTSIKMRYNLYEVEQGEIQSLWDYMVNGMVDMPQSPDEGFKEAHKYAYYQVEIPMGQWTRDGIINAIIRDKYRIDEMEAITNNMAAINAVFMQTLVTDGIVAATKYLKDSINDANTARFKEMQEWRAMAKKVASEIIKE